MKTLQECDFVTAANLLGCEVAAIKAVKELKIWNRILTQSEIDNL